MYCKKSVNKFVIILGLLATICLIPLSPAQCAENVYDVTACVSMDLSPLISSNEISVFIFEGKGIMRSNIKGKVFDNCTVHTGGTFAIQGAKRNAFAYLKYLAPDGDYLIFRYVVNPGDKEATTTILSGTGKWKGAIGGGKAKRITNGKPVAPGTVQFCNRHVGKFSLPK